jgi:hypothetical protein
VTVKQKLRNPDFDQILDALLKHSFELTPSTDVSGGVLISKHGAGAVLAAAKGQEMRIVFAVPPGAMVGDQVALLLDRGYQKFIKTSQFEIPATASQLHAIHLFTEELKQVMGVGNLYNEALGTTSDLYEYDRLKGRETAPPVPRRPSELAGGH